jgi:hypothetical protein
MILIIQPLRQKAAQIVIVCGLIFASMETCLALAHPRTFPSLHQEERQSERLGPGVEHISIRRGDLSGATGADRWSIHILEIDPRRARLSLVLAMDEIVGAELTSSMAFRSGALAAINGGYFRTTGLLRGEPNGIIARGRRLLSEPERRRSGLAMRASKRKIELAMARFDFKAEVVIGEREKRPIQGINRPRAAGEMILYTPEFHRTTLGGMKSCELIIARDRIERFSPRGGQTIPANGYILAAEGEKLCAWFAAQPRGRRVRLRSEIIADPPLPFTPDFIVGGGPRLLKGGNDAALAEADSFNEAFRNTRHPRTAVGVRPDGVIVLVTVDGRQPLHSVGMSIAELTALMSELGCAEAINLDGGGSTTMVVRDNIVNRPSDAAGERPVSDALLVHIR